MTHLEIIQKLIGPIHPIGETTEDAKRLENLKAMIELAEGLIGEINDVEQTSIGRHEYSIKKAGSLANRFMDRIKE